MNEAKVANIIMELSTKFDWIKSCVKQIDVTNVGRQYSLLPLINSSKSENNLEIEKSSKNKEDDFEIEY